MKTNVIWLLLLLLLISISGLYYFLSVSQDESPTYANVIEALASGEQGQGFARAVAPRQFIFPRDAGPHPDFQTEWWYYVGNLDSEDGRHFGYQLTIFRRALSPREIPRLSQWGTNQIYFAHFALTDVAKEKFYSFERFCRGSTGLAGARSVPFRVWVENWQIVEKQGIIHLTAKQDKISLELELKPLKPVVLHGDRGLSQKSWRPGNASYYYSQTRIHSQGTIGIGSTSFSVTGISWLDREWSTSRLGDNETGWHWFALQFDNQTELMLYHICLKDDGFSPFSAGTFIHRDGSTQHLKKDDFEIYALDQWQSPITGKRYPSAWKIHVPGKQIELEVTPYLIHQEHSHRFAYWEGAVKVVGGSFTGSGYVELVK